MIFTINSQTAANFAVQNRKVDIKERLLKLGKFESHTANAFNSHGIIDEYKWPKDNESSNESIIRRKSNSSKLKKHRDKISMRNRRRNKGRDAALAPAEGSKSRVCFYC